MNQTERSPAVARVVAVVVLASVLAACGRGEEEVAATPAPSAPPEPAAPVTAATAALPDDQRLANAVVTGKTAAPVDLKYDVLAKPGVGQPFEIELALLPRLPADALEVGVTGIPGLTVVSGATAKFDKATAGERYLVKVMVRADAPGIYYANVTARMVTGVQTEMRTFSVPVVVGSVPAAEKPQPAKDAKGEAIQSMPAVESGGTEPSKP